MAMLLDLPKMPRDVVDLIRTYVYGPQNAAFMANYGERIPTRVVRPPCGMLFSRDRSVLNRAAFNWGDGLRPRYIRFLWHLPTSAMHYLTRGMPVLLRLGADWASAYTVIEVRHSTLLVGFGTCEIEIPKAIILDITLYVDIFEVRRPGVHPDLDNYDLDLCVTDDVVEHQIPQDSQIGLVKNDDVSYARNKYTTERWLHVMQHLEGDDLSG